MAAVDAASAEPVEALIARAGAAVERAALDMLGGSYGRRVTVIAGKGNNGADGRVAAERLARRGVRVAVVAPDADELPRADLVIDAAYGTGLGRPFVAPSAGDMPVLAVDIASGVDGLTGEVLGEPLRASRTLCLGALKPGNVFEPGASLCGEVVVADLAPALDVSGTQCHLVEVADLQRHLPERGTTAHKWHSACWVVGGSPQMTGAPLLSAGGAAHSGAGYVRLSIPGLTIAPPGTMPETVVEPLRTSAWADEVVRGVDRVGSVVLGPGIGRETETIASVQHVVANLSTPLVVDADGLFAVAQDLTVLDGRKPGSTVLTPHDGEFGVLTGARPAADRIASARELAATTNTVVLLKGPATVIAAPDGRVRVSTAGDARLATAGTGDVLAGVIGSLLAQGATAFDAAWMGAELHGTAAHRGPSFGFVASDLFAGLTQWRDGVGLP
jgi:NAD(P)H-hydrate epimerase